MALGLKCRASEPAALAQASARPLIRGDQLTLRCRVGVHVGPVLLGEALLASAAGRTVGDVLPQPVAEQQVTALPLASGRADVHLDAQVSGTHHAVAGLAQAQAYPALFKAAR